MKKFTALCLALCLSFTLAACAQSTSDSETEQSESVPSSAVQEPVTEEPQENSNEQTQEDGYEQIPITLTIGDTVLEAYLNDSAPAKSLIAQLPLTVTLNESTNDFCGGSLDIDYSESDVTAGYRNGDIVFWPPASNFVIFVRGEEDSMGSDNLVKLGHITSPEEMLDTLSGQIEVTVALAEEE